MNTQRKIFQLGIVSLLFVFGIVGCEFFDQNSTSPTIPASLEQTSRFWVGKGADKYEVYQGNDTIQVGAPEGEYLFKYSVKRPLGDGEDGDDSEENFAILDFYVVFKSSEAGAYVTVGLLSGDTVWDASLISLQPGTISEDVDPVQESEGVCIYSSPSIATSISLANIFTISLESVLDESAALVVIILLVDGEPAEGGELTVLESPTWKFTIHTQVIGAGTVTPESESGIPYGASRSFKLTPYAGLTKVTLNDEDVTKYVTQSGTDGHLVIHQITGDILLVAEW